MNRYIDLLITASTGGVLVLLHQPWPLWLIWAGILVYQIGWRVNRATTRTK